MELTVMDRPRFEGQAGDRLQSERPDIVPFQACSGQQTIGHLSADDDGLGPTRYAPASFHWKTCSIVAAIHVAAASALLGLGIVDVPRTENGRLTVMDIQTPPPVPEPAPPHQSPVTLHTVTREEKPTPVKPMIELPSQAPAVIPDSPRPATGPEQVEGPPAPPAPPAPITPPNFSAAQLDNPGPSYPYASRRNREEGTVTLKVLVTPDGSAGTVEIHQSSGFDRLDAAAIQTVRKWRFIPATQAGKAIAAWVLVPIGFSLGR